MSPRLETALVRIVTDNQFPRQPVGAGFLVSPHHVLTCAHVIADVLHLPNDNDLLNELVYLDFPFLDHHPWAQAKVVCWYPVIEEVKKGTLEDIAVLALVETTPLPLEAQPIPLMALDTYFDRTVKLCGFPAGQDTGIYVDATLQGVTAKGYVQLNTALGHGQVAPGFSGTAVWDKQANSVVGMTVSIDDYQGDVPAYMIPASSLVKACPEIEASSRPPNPYRGLSAFREQDADLFFGRDQTVEELAALVEKQPFVALIGASGSGKSSVVSAGLMPRLSRTKQWRIVQTRPKTQPFRELATALVPLLYPDKLDQARELDRCERGLKTGELQLSAIFQLIQQTSPNQRLLLVIDQFEELYTLTADKTLQRQWIDVLLQPLPSPNYVLLLAIRADFMGQALAHDTFAQILDKYPDKKLGRMTDAELQQAIEQPALQRGVKLAAGLTQHILEDVGREAGNLPLLQFALTELWEHQQYRQLTHEAYQAIGGVHQALAYHADKVYQELSETGQAEKVRQVFVQLVRPGEGTEDTRQVATLAQVHPENQPLIAKLATARLVVTNRDEQDRETVEVVHEALIRYWGPLRKWIDADREFRRWQNGLRETIKGWQEAGQDAGALLRGVLLLSAEEKLTQYGERLADEERQFIEASVALREQERAEQERQQQEQERQRQERERLQRRNVRVLAVSFVIVVVLGLFGGWQWQKSDKRLQEARRAQSAVQMTQSWFLADLSRQQTERGFATEGLLLALEALPKDMNNPDRPYIAQVEHRLYQAFYSPRERYILPHEGNVNHVEFSPDGKQVITVSNDYTARLWDADSGELITILQGHTAPVYHAAFSADGQRVVTASLDNTAVIWNAHSGERLVSLPHKDRVTHAAFSADGQRVVTASWDNTAGVWEAHSGERLVSLPHEDLVFHAAFSADGQRVVTASVDNTARVWEAHSGERLVSLLHEGSVFHAAFSADGQRVVTASSDGTAGVWDVHSSERLISLPHESSVVHASFSADGQQVVTASHDNTAGVWDAHSGERLISLPHESFVYYAAFSVDGQWVVTASDDNTAKVWEAHSSERFISLPHKDRVNHAAFSADGQRVVTASDDNTAGVWEAHSGERLVSLKHEDDVIHAAFSADGQRVVTASSDGTAGVWNAHSGERLVSLPHEDIVTHTTFSADGQRVVTVSGDTAARVWDAHTGKRLVSLQHENRVTHADFSADGQRVVTVSGDTAGVWEVHSGERLVSLKHEDDVIHAAFSADGQRVVTASSDGTAGVWEAHSGECLVSLQHEDPESLQHEEHEDPEFTVFPESDVTHAAFSADGQRVVTASVDHTAGVWNAHSGERLVFLPHKHIVNHAAFSADGQRVVTASYDNTAWVWEAHSGERLVSLPHEDLVFHTAFSADGQRVVTVSDNNTAKIWTIFPSTQALIDEAKQQKSRDLTIAQREQFFLLGPIAQIAQREQFSLLVPDEMRQAQEKITQGKQLAEEGNFSAAQNAFKQALQLDKTLRFEPTVKAQVLTANALLAKGQELAETEKIEEATAVFAKVLAINANFAFDPKTKAKQIAATALVNQGESLAQDGKVDEAIIAIKRAQELDVNVTISTFYLDTLCRNGSLFGQAARVLEYCEMAVKLTNEQDAGIRDSRGLARALTGDYKGAITDFEFFVQHTDSEEMKKQHQDWIKALKRGDNPFTQAVLEGLK